MNYMSYLLSVIKCKKVINPQYYYNVTFGNIYQKYYYCLSPHVDPHLSRPTAQQWVSMCIRPICVHIDHLEVLAGIEME